MTPLLVCAAAVSPAVAFGPSAAAGVPADDPVSHVRLSWTADPATTITVRWTARSSGDAASLVRIRAVGSTAWSESAGTSIPRATGVDREALIEGLAPATAYEYEVSTGDGGWGATRTFSTAPLDGAFEAVFVADTGIVGRTDGLTTGTEQVLAEIEARAPLLVLGGGDYAYFNSERRFDELGAAIDAWLDQMEPIVSERAFMPTYGNHEVLLNEGVERWIARFATPDGPVGRSSYSFDVAGVHFISLLAYQGVIDADTEAWLVADLEAATAAGARAIVPYFHRNVYGDGTVHPPSPSLGRQLTRVFELYDVNAVLTAHDQSYERTFPLAGGFPTTTNRRCYTDADGISWIKISPGGKLSSENWSFSGYSVTPPNPTIVTREGGLHHYAVVRFGEGADFEVVTYGVTGDGDSVEVDAVRFAEACTAELAFTTLPPLLEMNPGDAPQTVPVALAGADQTVTLSSSAPWLTVGAVAADGTAMVTVDVDGLVGDAHAAEIRATSTDRSTTVLPVVVQLDTIDSDATLVVGAANDRSDRIVLEGAVVRGDVHVELVPGTVEAGEVRFLVDGERARGDRNAPFDLVGGSTDLADPWSTTLLADGEHLLEAVVIDPAGETTRTVSHFVVDNGGADPAAPTVTGDPFVPVVVADPSTTDPGSVDASGSDLPTTSAAPPVTFAPSVPIDVQDPEPESWWTSTSGLLVGLALVGALVACAGAIGRWFRRRRSDHDPADPPE